jgi:uncharacterized MAPEG superfamily protein
MVSIVVATIVAVLLWFALRFHTPLPAGMDDVGARLVLALKCSVIAVLFALVPGVEAVAHERLRSAAFDPLAPYDSRRMAVNQRYLQNTLEQSVVFVIALLGLAIYTPGEAARALTASTVVWLLARWAFWAGYHQGAAMRGLGAPSMMLGLLMLLYVGFRIGSDVGGEAGGWAVVAAFVAFEALLFWGTRPAGGSA